MNNWRKMFDVPEDAVIEALERIKREHYEYCPICKRRMEYKGVVTIDEILKNDRLLVLWWFDRRMNIEVWRRDLVTEKGAPGPGFEPGSRARQARMIGRATLPGLGAPRAAEFLKVLVAQRSSSVYFLYLPLTAFTGYLSSFFLIFLSTAFSRSTPSSLASSIR